MIFSRDNLTRAVAAAPSWKVLLVDDEPDILESLKGLIEEGLPGTKVVTCRSGRTALELLSRSSGVHLLVSDFKMPEMDGLAFLAEARRRYPYIPRVMLTAYPSPDLEAKARDEASVDAFLSKAGSPTQILAAIKRLSADLQRRLGYDIPR